MSIFIYNRYTFIYKIFDKMGKRWLSEITDNFLDYNKYYIDQWYNEWKNPATDICNIFCWYKINTQWKVFGQAWKPMKYIFRKWKRSPFVILKINKKTTKWKFITTQEEVRIDKLMEEKFWTHIKNYSKTVSNYNKKYIIVPQDWDWGNMNLKNLEYVLREEYNLNNTKKQLLLAIIPFFPNKTDEELAKQVNASRWRVSKIKKELKIKWTIWNKDLNNLIISHKTYPIYVKLLDCNWLKSNLEIAKILWPDEDLKDPKNQKNITNRVVRVRKKLYQKWLIKKYNTYQQTTNK